MINGGHLNIVEDMEVNQIVGWFSFSKDPLIRKICISLSKLLSTILQPRHVHQVEAGAPDGEGHREQGVRVRGEQELQDLLRRPAEAQ